jgi:hypothetical protein
MWFYPEPHCRPFISPLGGKQKSLHGHCPTSYLPPVFISQEARMVGLNPVAVLGNLGTDPEVRRTAKEVAMCRFRFGNERVPKES